MAFPTTSVLDDFNRANTGPPPSASWSTGAIPGNGGMKVVSNQVGGDTNSGCDAYYNVATYGPDSEAYITLAVKPATTAEFWWLSLRLATPGTAGVDGYEIDVTSNAVSIWRVTNGGYTQLGSDISVTFANGEKLGAEIIGSTLAVYRYTGGAWGAALGTRTDSTYSAAGSIGIGADEAAMRGDDFGGGTVVTASGNVPRAILRPAADLYPIGYDL